MKTLTIALATTFMFGGVAAADEAFVLGADQLDTVTGGVGFSTAVDIDLAVNKLKNIELVINKDVDSSFNGENVLADAEAFADSQGFTGLLAETLTVTQVDGFKANAYSQSTSGGSGDATGG